MDVAHTDVTTLDVVDLAKVLISIRSESQFSNLAITDLIESYLSTLGFDVERLEYVDIAGESKACLIAKVGHGAGGLGIFAHSDTVPGMPDHWTPFEPRLDGSKLIGRGSCDMKGPIAAALAAASRLPVNDLRAPLYFVVSADEEMHYTGAYNIISRSETLKSGWPKSGLVIEPTSLRPVYAHKGGIRIRVRADGIAAHTSTGIGVSANFLIAPFLAEMAELAELFRHDSRFQDNEFDPPTNGFNMVLDDGGCALNVTAQQTVCTLSIRPMTDDNHEEAVRLIQESATKHGLESATFGFPVMHTDPDTEIVRTAVEVTGVSSAVTAPYGTEAAVYKEFSDLVVLGPGSILQAHTIGEWIDINELSEAVDVYRHLMQCFCLPE